MAHPPADVYVSEDEIRRYGDDVYLAISAQFRGRLAAGVKAHPQNAAIFRRAFANLDSQVDRLFDRLDYREGEPWEQWKLMAAFYLVEVQIGKNASTMVGTKIFETMPWPPSVRCLEDALKGIDGAYRASHHGAASKLIGGWPVLENRPGFIRIACATPYPCHMEEGTIAGVCSAFREQRPTYELLSDPPPKRDGGLQTLFEVRFVAHR